MQRETGKYELRFTGTMEYECDKNGGDGRQQRKKESVAPPVTEKKKGSIGIMVST